MNELDECHLHRMGLTGRTDTSPTEEDSNTSGGCHQGPSAPYDATAPSAQRKRRPTPSFCNFL